MILLDKNERDKFATWLEQEAHSDDALARQAEKLPGMDVVVKRYKMEAVAAGMIARKLRNIEDFTA